MHATPAESSQGHHLVETDLDRLSNSVVSLVDEGRLDEADAACEQLRTRYPEVHDWLMRKAMVCEARGETELAIEYWERTIAWMDAHPENFDPESRKPFRKDIERLRGSLGRRPLIERAPRWAKGGPHRLACRRTGRGVWRPGARPRECSTPGDPCRPARSRRSGSMPWETSRCCARWIGAAPAPARSTSSSRPSSTRRGNGRSSA